MAAVTTNRRLPLAATASLLAAILAGACGADPAASPATEAPPSGDPAGAVCTPVEVAGPDGRQIDLSGTWSGNDGGRYYIKQIDSCVWWAGLSDFANQALGEEWIMTFRGTLNADGVVSGDFVDVKGTNPGSGTMAIRVAAEQRDGQVVVELHREQVTGHQIGVTFWQRSTADATPSPAATTTPDDTGASTPSEPPTEPDDTPPTVTLPPP